MSYLTKQIKVYRELEDGQYKFKFNDWKIVGLKKEVEELKSDLITLGYDEDKIQIVTELKGKAAWFIQLQGVVQLTDESTVKRNINLYPDESKDVDQLTFQLSAMLKQLGADEDADIISILENCLKKEFDIWVYTNNVYANGTLKAYKNTSFSKPKTWDADADFE